MTQKALLQSAGDGTAVPQGYVGQELYSIVDISSGVNVLTNNTYFDITNRALTAGTWMVSGYVTYLRNAATITATDYEAGIWGTSGNSTTGRVLGLNTTSQNLATNTYTTQSIAIPNFIVRCDGSNIFYPDGSSTSGIILYLKGFSSTCSAGNIKGAGRLTATRIA